MAKSCIQIEGIKDKKLSVSFCCIVLKKAIKTQNLYLNQFILFRNILDWIHQLRDNCPFYFLLQLCIYIKF